MSETPDSTLSPLQTALVVFTGCIGSAFDDICSYGLTIGEQYVPFDPDPEDECEEDEAACSQLWVRVASTSVIDVTEGWDNGGCGGTLSLLIEVGILRCIEVPEDGEAPTAADVLVASLQSMEDMQKIYCAAMACEVWEGITVGDWAPTGPLGGQYGGIWNFTVTV